MSDRPPRTPTLYERFQLLENRQKALMHDLRLTKIAMRTHMTMPHTQPELGQRLDRLERMTGRLQRVVVLMAIALLLVVGLHFWR